ncbi:MAG: hypothetical protein WC607_01415 [Candidatus Micrarchaeia archaeon]
MEKPKTPFINVELEPSIWKSNANEGVAWWSLDLGHRLFKKGPYNGVEHGEVFLYEKESGREKVFNLSVDSGAETNTYSFKFAGEGCEKLFEFNNGGANKQNEVKALKIACELLFHHPDAELRGELVTDLLNAIEDKKTEKKTVWDKV